MDPWTCMVVQCGDEAAVNAYATYNRGEIIAYTTDSHLKGIKPGKTLMCISIPSKVHPFVRMTIRFRAEGSMKERALVVSQISSFDKCYERTYTLTLACPTISDLSLWSD